MTRERDAELSALLDGALASPEETALRAELARDPALAARLEQLARVDAALRALPARQVPADLRARLQAKLDAEARSAAPASARGQLAAIRGGAPARPSRRRAWIAGISAAAAAAAAALLVVVAGPSAQRGENVDDATQLADVPAANLPQSASTDGALATASERAPNVAAGADAPPESTSLPAAGGKPNPATLAAAGEAEESAPRGPLAGDAAPGSAAALAAAAPNAEAPAGELEAPRIAESAAAAPVGPALASTTTPAVQPPPALWIDATDDEAAALGELEAADAGVVAVLDWLGALDALEAEAS